MSEKKESNTLKIKDGMSLAEYYALSPEDRDEDTLYFIKEVQSNVSITDIIPDDMLKDLNDGDIKKIKEYVERLIQEKDESQKSPCLRKGCRDISTCCGCPEYTEWKKKYKS